ncbi:uncharacterized protein ColSpa_10121 [Colletotrichum spaethianum]|uniref:Uncharacterized protein n=1 Tax=Colletotrichum spaethianum TaxID=700344 RepID=A0AA37PCV7_9PEZI|nr:uncharacterized protein ColSpa_10121 [Colletotrichum spaethianum]GKT49940.1 hypothetical protein ColSpa_10121 [Colletotrichum spaethianum]
MPGQRLSQAATLSTSGLSTTHRAPEPAPRAGKTGMAVASNMKVPRKAARGVSALGDSATWIRRKEIRLMRWQCWKDSQPTV